MKKNMNENFECLKDRVLESFDNSDLERINYYLSKIDGPTLVSGVGGSSVVAEFVMKVLSLKNHIITRNIESRDFVYFDYSLYRNVLSCSYSGNNYGVFLSFSNDLNHYLLSSNENNREDIINLNYSCSSKEKSFISLAATLIPCSILLNYLLDNDKDRVINMIENYSFSIDQDCDCFEIFSGFETSVASKFLESTMVESGIGIPIVHDKYSYCHGRSTFCTVRNNIAIYFDTSTELDNLLLAELRKHYKDIIVLKCEQSILGEYELLVKCMYLTKSIAEFNQKDLSDVNYNPVVKKLYKYNGRL